MNADKPATLFLFFKSNDEWLPPIPVRAKMYASYGFGSAESYRGTYEQNVRLLAALIAHEEKRATGVNP
jgi:hypothetical protein